jgi:hypothetical protein
MERSYLDQSDADKSFRVKKMRPEEKSFGERSQKGPLLNWRNLANHS